MWETMRAWRAGERLNRYQIMINIKIYLSPFAFDILPRKQKPPPKLLPLEIASKRHCVEANKMFVLTTQN